MGSELTQLSVQQRALVSMLAQKLSDIRGVEAVVLGGSYARGCAVAGSDIDLGVFYSETASLSLADLRELAELVNDLPNPVVTGFYEWGPWVNGGAWLTIGGQRVDFIYRNLEHVERVIGYSEAGRYELDYAQQPPFGFFSGTYLGEIAICLPLFDNEGRIEKLKQRVRAYPEALRRNVVQDYLWSTEFGLAAFARKFASRSDVYGTTACLARAIHQLTLVLFALNRRYLLNDKTALTEVAEFEYAPQDFVLRVQKTLANVGASAQELKAAVENITRLFEETAKLANGLYQSRYTMNY